MNSMTHTADFSLRTAPAAHQAPARSLRERLLALLLLAGGMNSIDPALLAERIVLD